MATRMLHWDETPPAEFRAGAAAFGNFDGVHRGHAALLAELRRQADTVGGPAVAVTFDPHPLLLLRPESFQPVLTTPADRAELLHAAGANHVVLLRTTPELLKLGAADFFERMIRGRLGARALVEGPDFGFGRNREGNIDLLKTFCRAAEIGLTVLTPFTWHGTPVSSSRVRAALMRGAVREAADLLDRPYRLAGRVGAGQQRGRTLGFPTANLVDVPTLVPGDGVYAARAYARGGSWPAATNIGPNPTFGEPDRKVEVHLIGFVGDLYGETLAVEFLERLRDTRPFANVEQLVQQLRTDVEHTARVVSEDSTLPVSNPTESLKDRVARVLREEVGPALQMDGLCAEVLAVADGVARVRLEGYSCCPGTVLAIVNHVEQELRKHVAEVEYVEIVP